MTSIGARKQKKPARYWSALLVFALCAAAAYWALTTLFSVELHQVGQWLLEKMGALRK